MILRTMVVRRKGKAGPGAFVCHYCRQLIDNRAGLYACRAGNDKGVWICQTCGTDLIGA